MASCQLQHLGIRKKRVNQPEANLQIESKLGAKSNVANSIRSLTHAFWASTQDHLWLFKADLLQTHEVKIHCGQIIHVNHCILTTVQTMSFVTYCQTFSAFSLRGHFIMNNLIQQLCHNIHLQETSKVQFLLTFQKCANSFICLLTVIVKRWSWTGQYYIDSFSVLSVTQSSTHYTIQNCKKPLW